MPKNPNDELSLDEPVQQKQHIKVEIDSVDKLTGALRYATLKLNESADKLTANRELTSILNVLQDFKRKDLDFLTEFDKQIQAKVDKFDFSKFEKQIDTKIGKNIEVLDKSSKKLKNYTDAFNDDELLDSLDKIENTENFLNNFNFKSIIFSSLVGFLTAFGLGLAAVYYLPIQQLQQQIIKKTDDLSSFFDKNDYRVGKTKDGKIQLKISKKNISYIDSGSSKMWIFQKD